tara:strand:+ start:397 stop:708 length:312 start_codon:yes stop_codon:yes gene_type:complete
MSSITDPERIKKVLEQYEKKRQKEKDRYQLIKDTDDFKLKNRERARNYYGKNQQNKKDKYENDKDFLSARSQYYYYKRNDRLDIFKEKYPNKVEVLSQRNIVF